MPFGQPLGEAFVRIRPDTTGFAQQLSSQVGSAASTANRQLAHIGASPSAVSGMRRFTSRLRSLAAEATVQAGVAVLGGLGIGATVSLLKDAASAASNLVEQTNKARVVFGQAAAGVEAFAKTSADSFGIAQDQALEFAGTFGNFLVPMGLSQRQAAQMSVTLVKLAADMASFNNASPEDVLLAIRSALAGEIEPLRRFGVFLTQSRIEAEALSSGLVKAKVDLQAVGTASARVAIAQAQLNKAVREHGANSIAAAQARVRLEQAERALQRAMQGTTPELTAAQKAQATLNIILQDTKAAQGDFARTSDQLANTQRRLNALWREAKIRIGEELLPRVLSISRGMVAWLRDQRNLNRLGRVTDTVLSGIARAASLVAASLQALRPVATVAFQAVQATVSSVGVEPILAAALAWRGLMAVWQRAAVAAASLRAVMAGLAAATTAAAVAGTGAAGGAAAGQAAAAGALAGGLTSAGMAASRTSGALARLGTLGRGLIGAFGRVGLGAALAAAAGGFTFLLTRQRQWESQADRTREAVVRLSQAMAQAGQVARGAGRLQVDVGLARANREAAKLAVEQAKARVEALRSRKGSQEYRQAVVDLTQAQASYRAAVRDVIDAERALRQQQAAQRKASAVERRARREAVAETEELVASLRRRATRGAVVPLFSRGAGAFAAPGPSRAQLEAQERARQRLIDRLRQQARALTAEAQAGDQSALSLRRAVVVLRQFVERTRQLPSRRVVRLAFESREATRSLQAFSRALVASMARGATSARGFARALAGSAGALGRLDPSVRQGVRTLILLSRVLGRVPTQREVRFILDPSGVADSIPELLRQVSGAGKAAEDVARVAGSTLGQVMGLAMGRGLVGIGPVVQGMVRAVVEAALQAGMRRAQAAAQVMAGMVAGGPGFVGGPEIQAALERQLAEQTTTLSKPPRKTGQRIGAALTEGITEGADDTKERERRRLAAIVARLTEGAARLAERDAREAGRIIGGGFAQSVGDAIRLGQSRMGQAVSEAMRNLVSIVQQTGQDLADALDTGPLGRKLKQIQDLLERRRTAQTRAGLVRDVEDANKALTKEVEDAKKRVADMQKALSEEQEAVAEAQKELRRRRQELAEARARIITVGEPTPAQQRAIAKFLQPQVDAVEEARKTLRKARDRVKEAKEALKDAQADVPEVRRAAQQRLADARQALSMFDLERDAANLEARLTRMGNRLRSRLESITLTFLRTGNINQFHRQINRLLARQEVRDLFRGPARTVAGQQLRSDFIALLAQARLIAAAPKAAGLGAALAPSVVNPMEAVADIANEQLKEARKQTKVLQRIAAAAGTPLPPPRKPGQAKPGRRPAAGARADATDNGVEPVR